MHLSRGWEEAQRASVVGVEEAQRKKSKIFVSIHQDRNKQLPWIVDPMILWWADFDFGEPWLSGSKYLPQDISYKTKFTTNQRSSFKVGGSMEELNAPQQSVGVEEVWGVNNNISLIITARFITGWITYMWRLIFKNAKHISTDIIWFAKGLMGEGGSYRGEPYWSHKSGPSNPSSPTALAIFGQDYILTAHYYGSLTNHNGTIILWDNALWGSCNGEIRLEICHFQDHFKQKWHFHFLNHWFTGFLDFFLICKIFVLSICVYLGVPNLVNFGPKSTEKWFVKVDYFWPRF